MKTCRSCGLPAPRSTLRCAYCSGSFPAANPAVYRVAPGGAGYEWLRHESVLVLRAHAHAGAWRICRPGSDDPVLTLLAREAESGDEAALIGPRGEVAASLAGPGTDPRTLAVASDGGGSMLAVVRGDGPSGIHLVDGRGEVTALASRAGPGHQVALDVLVTRPGADADEALLFGILLGLELMRLGQLAV